MNRGCILIVDDEEAIAEFLAVLLDDEGYMVVTASNGAEALRRAAETAPALVISDVMMPVMSGTTLLAQLRAQKRFRTTPFVFMSAAGRVPEVAKDQYAAFLPKPLNLEEILQLVEQLIGPP